VDALSRNPVGPVADDNDFGEEIPDFTDVHAGLSGFEEKILCVQTGEETDWMGTRRKDR
jgi:hypothetical protein